MDQPPYARQLVLRPGGRIAGYRNDSERRWELRHGVLVLLDRAGLATTRFDHSSGPDGARILEGPFLAGPGVRHRLTQVPLLGALAPSADALPLALRAGRTRRRNLVILRAGATSIHRSWSRDIDDAERSWDLCISWYDDPARFVDDPDADYHVVQNDTQKWPAIHRLLAEGSPFWDYDYVLCPDDDLDWSWRGINLAFETMRDLDLLLAQPSLAHEGYPVHDITRRVDGSRVRFTGFVEVMTPIFSRDALRVCAPTFALSRIGFGLDHLWPKLLGDPDNRVAIIDETAVVHTRPQAQNYDLSAAIVEGRELTASFSAAESYQQFGQIRPRPA